MSHLSEYEGILFTKTLMNIKLDIVDRKKYSKQQACLSESPAV